MNYRNIINKGTTILKKNAILTANIDAEWLLSIAINKTREKIECFGYWTWFGMYLNITSKRT